LKRGKRFFRLKGGRAGSKSLAGVKYANKGGERPSERSAGPGACEATRKKNAGGIGRSV